MFIIIHEMALKTTFSFFTRQGANKNEQRWIEPPVHQFSSRGCQNRSIGFIGTWYKVFQCTLGQQLSQAALGAILSLLLALYYQKSKWHSSAPSEPNHKMEKSKWVEGVKLDMLQVFLFVWGWYLGWEGALSVVLTMRGLREGALFAEQL